MHRAVGLQFPSQLPAAPFDRVEVRVVGSDQHQILGDRRRRLHFAVGLEGPESLAVAHPDGVHGAGKIADEDCAVAHRGRRLADEAAAAGLVLPTQPAGLEVERNQLALRRSNVDHAVNDGGGRLDRLAGLVGPFQRQRGGRRHRGDAGEVRVAAELRPVRGGRWRLGGQPQRKG